eukprot:12801306-Ditylum_brightwellii.AAC.1
MQQDGSADKPYIIHVGFDYPERHMGFEVLKVNGIMHTDKYEYDVITIRHTIDFGDRAVWDTKVAFDRIPADLQYRAIMITAPALGEFTREVD